MTSPVQTPISAYHFSGDEPNDYYAKICEQLMIWGKDAAPRGLPTKELHPTTAHIYKPRNRIMTCHGRVLNLPFALAEVIQILTGQNDAQALRFYNSQIIKIQGDLAVGQSEDEIHRFNAFYGERLRAFSSGQKVGLLPQPVDQLKHVIETLRADPDSRQASIVLSHPFWDNYTIATKDRACNVYCHAMIRDGKLDWMQIIRSNDAVWGIPYNMIQWSHVMEWVAASLKVPMGNLFIVQDSFHVYEPKYEECLVVEPFSLYKYIAWELNPMQVGPSTDTLWLLQDIETRIRAGINFVHGDWVVLANDIGLYWVSVLRALHSYSLFKDHLDEAAYEALPGDPEMRLPMLRMYCHYRWNKKYTKYNRLVAESYNSVVAHGVPQKEANRWLGIV